MKLPSANLCIIAVVVALGGYTLWVRMHPKPVKYHQCYPEKAVAKPKKKPGQGELDAGLIALIGSPRRISEALVLTLGKDSPSWFADPLRRFQARGFDEIFSPDGAARNDIRDLLFAWARVQGIDPASRGPFIDARELAFLERLMNEPFLQIGRYPNPAPMGAAGMREGFRRILDYVYAEFAAHAGGKELFDFKSPGGNLLSPAALGRIRTKANSLDKPARLRLWQNVIRAIPHDVDKNLSRGDHALLNAEIGESLPGYTEKTVRDSIPIDTEKVFTDRDSRVVAFNIIFAYDMNSRTICYLYPDE
ncbi:MAG TPA: hypothetical protein VEF76_01720 [Patescibacteria group bacterium]|nr:hypothetical protein [Patescibacteria group bacterium]